jgi:hypothetical protein
VQESQLVPWVKGVPFEPFSLFLVDGRQIDVRHPEAIMLAEYALTLYVFHPARQIEIVDVASITSIRSLGEVDPGQYIR